jgi:hypothetical protein
MRALRRMVLAQLDKRRIPFRSPSQALRQASLLPSNVLAAYA